MSEDTSIIREQSELHEKLMEQIQLLQHYCERYDNGKKIFQMRSRLFQVRSRPIQT